MNKVGKTTRPSRYDLNQIPYAYTVEVRNRFKGLDLIEYLMKMDGGLTPGSGRSPRGGNGNPLQYSVLGNPVDRRAWWATVHGGHKELAMTEQRSLSL